MARSWPSLTMLRCEPRPSSGCSTANCDAIRRSLNSASVSACIVICSLTGSALRTAATSSSSFSSLASRSATSFAAASSAFASPMTSRSAIATSRSLAVNELLAERDHEPELGLESTAGSGRAADASPPSASSGRDRSALVSLLFAGGGGAFLPMPPVPATPSSLLCSSPILPQHRRELALDRGEVAEGGVVPPSARPAAASR